jgi:tRNA A-37 threonylcarbamoyl transferase component Bud32
LVVVTTPQGEMLAQHFIGLDERLIDQILAFSGHVAGANKITSACVCGQTALDFSSTKAPVEVLLVIRGFAPKVMNYSKTFDGRSVIVIGVDKWVFERDVERGFLGEAVAWLLILPRLALINEEYLRSQEVTLKKRLILEVLENLVLDYPELSYELYVKPEYFFCEIAMSRARLFPPIMYNLWNLMKKGDGKGDMDYAFRGFSEALRNLEKQGEVSFSEGYVRMSEDFVHRAQKPKVRLISLTKTLPRALFTSILDVWPRILNVLSQDWQALFKPRKGADESSIMSEIESPEKYLYIPTASGLVPLGNRTDVEGFARKILPADKNAKIEVEPIGGFLNDVYQVKTSVNGREKKVVVKRFRDWSSFKWFPLALWSIGTRTFAVLGRQRLERESATNRFLHSKGFSVPRLLHVSPRERLVFMDYIDGEDASAVIRRLASIRSDVKAEKDLKIITEIGGTFARVHALGIALGDTKPENVMIDKIGEIYLMDFEQASRRGDKIWDVAEFLYYAGHHVPPRAGAAAAEAVAKAFVSGYLEAGGRTETVRKAANPKYTKVFSIFTLPNVILAISNVCRKAGAQKIKGAQT